MKITYLIPEPSSKGGMTAITKMFYEVNYFDNINTFHFNTSFKSSIRFIRFFEFFGKQFKFLFHLIAVKPDVIFVMSNSYIGFFDKILYCLLARFFGVKSMLNHVGGEFDKFYRKNSLVRFLVDRVILVPNVLLIGSDFWSNYFKKQFPKVKVINSPNPIICSQYSGKVERNNDGRFVVSSLFRIIKEKGVYELIGVARNVIVNSENIDFVIMGGGPLLDFLKIEMDEFVKSGRVRILGFVEDEVKVKEICASDLYLMLTHFDLMPISIMEAMAAGKPILSTTVGGIPDLVKNGINGFLFDVGQVDIVANKVVELSKSGRKYLEMGQIGKNMVLENYDVHSIINLHKSIALSLLKQN